MGGLLPSLAFRASLKLDKRPFFCAWPLLQPWDEGSVGFTATVALRRAQSVSI